jgi:phenylacetate-CoA ligase
MVGSYFQTGPYIGLSDLTEIEDQVDWIERHRPDYILAQSAKLEHVALAFQDRPAPAGLRGLLAISQQLTGEMRRRIEGSLGVRVDQNYGLNEIGIVASRCPEGERYHVHAEHCLVEIVDGQGQPCAPGQRGRLLATGLNNPAMPLVRYDTDDLAEVAEGPCPCGRTLPSFAGLHGRYRRTIALPAGTWEYWDALLKALEEMPRELSRNLRQYQLHQYRSGEFKLRIVAASPLPEGFLERIYRGWAGGARGPVVPLEILQVDRIENAPGAKFQNFVSDFF